MRGNNVRSHVAEAKQLQVETAQQDPRLAGAEVPVPDVEKTKPTVAGISDRDVPNVLETLHRARRSATCVPPGRPL